MRRLVIGQACHAIVRFMSHAETLKAIASITDTGLFERLSTAVLRESNHLYESLKHTGVNTCGQTIKGPLHNIPQLKIHTSLKLKLVKTVKY